MDRTQKLGKDSVGKLLFNFSLPAIVGMLVGALYNIVDRIFVGNGVGTLGITGITVCFPIMVIFMAFGMLVAIGGVSLFSIKMGEKRRDQAETILGNSFLLTILILFTLAFTFRILHVPILKLFGASREALPYASDYLRIILIGVPIQGISMGMNNFIRAEGRPAIAMGTQLIGALLNIALDPLFIFVLDMGVSGAALATVLAQSVSAMWVLHYFFMGRSLTKIHRQSMKIDVSLVKQIFAIGMAPFAMQIAASAIVTIFNRSLLVYGGNTAISAFGIIHSITMLLLMPIIGISQGVQPIIGYNYGARNTDRVKRALLLAVSAATFIVTAGFILTRIFPVEIISLFNKKDDELIRIGTQGIRVFLLLLPLVGFQITCSNYFQAVGKGKKSLFLSMSRQVLVLIPALLILPRFFGLEGIWMASPVSDFTSTLVTGLFIFYEMRHLSQDMPAVHADMDPV